MGGLTPFPGQTAYSASKGAVKLWTEGLQAELTGTRVAVTVVFPGAIATDIARLSGVSDASVDTADSKIKMTSAPDAGRQIGEEAVSGKRGGGMGSDAR